MQRSSSVTGHQLLAAACALAVAGCARDPGQERLEGRDTPPPAAMVSPRQEAEALDSQLQRLLAELAAGMEGDPERLLQAEAISDGLLEARRPFDWLATGYDVEARLRQLQAMADRVVAHLRRGADLAAVAEDVEAMANSLNDLRAQLAAGQGGPAPPTLDSLLARDPRDLIRRPGGAPAVPAGVETPETPTEPDSVQPADDDRPLGAPVGN